MGKYIGDKKFYRMVLCIAVPIFVQNGITNFVNMLDNVMVGRIGTEPMSGVSIVNQLIFIFNLCIFGGFSGAGIFTAQYSGLKDNNGIRQTCRFKILLGIVISAVAIFIFLVFGDKLIGFYLNEGSDGNLAETLGCGLSYIRIMVWGLPAFMLVQALGSTLRECGQTVLPMKAGIAAVTVNLIFNWLLIFGNLGFPCLGVEGAAIATVISRFVEAGIVVVWLIKHKKEYLFAEGLLDAIKVDGKIAGQILRIGSPLLLNEFLFSTGMSMLIQCYSMRGLDSVAGFNISNTVINVFRVVLIAMGNSVGIIIGNLLGAGKMEEAVETDRKLIVFAIMLATCVSLMMLAIAPLFPQIYNTSESVKTIACHAIMVGALFMPVDAFKSTTYFTLRSGGKTWITFIFDGAYVWGVSVVIAFILSRFTTLSSVQIYFFVGCGDIFKVILGYVLVKKRVWLSRITV